jgi:membrane protease YdiL (CAAX protease family)
MPALSISPSAFVVILLGLIIMASLFSAVCLALSTFARTYKEGQAYLTPALLLVMPLSMVAILPNMNLDSSMALIPVANMSLLMKGLLVGPVPLDETILTLTVNLLLSGAALYWTAGLFSREEVLFREGRQVFGLKPPPGVVRPARPGLAAALLGVCFGFVWFVQVSMQLIAQPVVTQVTVPLLGLAFIAIALTKFSMAPLTSGLGLSLPRKSGWLAAVLLGGGGVALSLSLGALQQKHFPATKEFVEQMERALRPILEMPLPLRLLILAIVPAVCEELLYRGLVLQGARSTLGNASAVVLSAVTFAYMHNIGSEEGLPRFVPQLAIGLLLGWMVIRTGSIWPAIVAHAIHNGIVIAFQSTEEADAGNLDGLMYSVPLAFVLLVAAFAVSKPPRSNVTITEVP